MSEEEKKAIEDLKNAVNEPLEVFENVVDTFKLINLDQCRILLNLIDEQQKEIEELKVLEDDINNKNIAYIDEPEFEEKFISKDKIRELLNSKDVELTGVISYRELEELLEED